MAIIRPNELPEKSNPVSTAVTIVDDGTSVGKTTLAQIADAAGSLVDGDFPNNGLMVRTGAGSYTNRSIVAGEGLSVSNGSGASANPSIALNGTSQAAIIAAATAVQPDDLAAVATTGDYTDLANTPSLATVATSGDYDDLSNKPTLGSAAAANTGDFATAEQGGLADTAVQPGDLATVATSGEAGDVAFTPAGGIEASNVQDALEELDSEKANSASLATVATSGDYDDLSNTPTLGTAAAADTGDFAAAARGLPSGGLAGRVLAKATGDDYDVEWVEQSGGGGGGGDVASRDVLKALSASAGDARYLKEAGRQGWFIFDDADLSSEVSADTLEGIYVAPDSDDTGASGAWVRSVGGHLDAGWFGAAPGGSSADNTSALQAGLAMSAAMHLPLTIPGGTFAHEGLAPPTGSTLRGAGRGVTILELAGGLTANSISFSGVSDIRVADITLDGQRSLQSGGHGVRFAWSERVAVERLHILDPHSYGIGIQSGTNSAIRLSDIVIEGSGGDGIDIKCTATSVTGDTDGDLPNEAVSLDNIRVVSWGVNGSLSGQAALDIRGECMLSNIFVKGLTSDRRGIRFRPGEVNDGSNGVGAHRSRLVNFRVVGDGTGTSIGVSIEAPYVQIANGFVTGAITSVAVFQHECVLANIIAHGGTTGFLIDAGSGLATDANRTELVNCQARSHTTAFSIESDENSLTNCTARNATTGFLSASGANSNSVIGGGTSATSTPVTDNGAGNTFVGVLGYAEGRFPSSISVGQGIAFPATMNASSDPNTLDDYEEGTFAPGVSFGGGSAGVAYSQQTGKYTKVGNLVYYAIDLRLSNKGSSTGDALITGLPFAASGLVTATSIGHYSGMSSVTGLTAVISSSTIIPYNATATAASQLTDANFNNNTIIRASGMYFTS